MKFVYAPDGVDPMSWEFDPNKMINAECIEIERRTGWDFAEWLERFKRANMAAVTAYLYVMLKRETPGIKYESIQFTMSDFNFEPTDEELAEARHNLEAKKAGEGLTDLEETALTELIAAEVKPVEPAPKD